jgi:hypothetical protein
LAGQTTFRKREKERARQDRQQEKDLKRKARKEERGTGKAGDPANPGEDPDIAGIVPGPQPIILE